MDSGNSGSISSSGDEEYDSRADHTGIPSPFLNQFGSISQPQSSLVSSHYHQTQHHPSLFDLSSSYLHALSQPQPNSSNPNSFLNLDTATSSQGRRSEPDCTDITGVSSSSSTPPTATTGGNSMNQCLLGPQVTDNARVVLSSSQGNNVVRNSKKRTRASRRAPTTVLTTDTSNFRAMVQEFTGIPAPPFSASSSYSRRLDLLTGSSSLRSSTSHLDTPTGTPFYPLRPSPQKLHHHHQNPLLLSSSSSPSTLLHNNMVDAIASSTTTTNNSSSNNNSINYQQLPPDLGLPYHNPQNIMLSMQNHPPLAFHTPPPPPLHPFGNNLPTGFSAKLPSIEDLGMSHGQVNNANFVASGVSVPSGHAHVSSEGVTLRNVNDDGGGRRDVPLRSLDGGSCKLNFSAASASASLNHEKSNLENNNNNNNTTRGEGTVDSWICSSD